MSTCPYSDDVLAAAIRIRVDEEAWGDHQLEVYIRTLLEIQAEREGMRLMAEKTRTRMLQTRKEI